jgi:hypothetical protein
MPTLRLCVGHPTATETLGADELICLRTMKRRYRRIDERPSQHELSKPSTPWWPQQTTIVRLSAFQ